MKSLRQIYEESFALEETADGREFLALVKPILTHPAVSVLEEYRHHMSVNRLQHVVSVAYIAYHICRKQCLRVEETCLAALLHDLFYFDHTRGDRPAHPWRRHPAIAWDNARQLHPFTEVGEDIISRHMWPLTLRLPRTQEGRIVSWADKYCAWQEFLLSCKQMLYIRKDAQL